MGYLYIQPHLLINWFAKVHDLKSPPVTLRLLRKNSLFKHCAIFYQQKNEVSETKIRFKIKFAKKLSYLVNLIHLFSEIKVL